MRGNGEQCDQLADGVANPTANSCWSWNSQPKRKFSVERFYPCIHERIPCELDSPRSLNLVMIVNYPWVDVFDKRIFSARKWKIHFVTQHSECAAALDQCQSQRRLFDE